MGCRLRLVTRSPCGSCRSSRPASPGNNTGGFEAYRAGKSALNQLVRSFTARHADDPRTLLLMSAGWVPTALSGPDAPLAVDQSILGLADAIESQPGKGGLHYLDRHGRPVAW
ncbi:hypothetical protein [Streptomyces sp. NPDC048419]|uniref:hypothetical protein n=1 Tax=Streptomyces sp. NPDC048419 TaxID=3365547 RepID=UPI0037194712